MRRLRRYLSITMWLYGGAIAIPDGTLDRHLPAPIAATVDGAFDLVETAASEAAAIVAGQAGFRDRAG